MKILHCTANIFEELCMTIVIQTDGLQTSQVEGTLVAVARGT